MNPGTELNSDTFKQIKVVKDPDSDQYNAVAVLQNEVVVPLDGTAGKSMEASRLLAETIITRMVSSGEPINATLPAPPATDPTPPLEPIINDESLTTAERRKLEKKESRDDN